MKVCVVGASGKLGQYLVRHALDRGYEVVGVSRSPHPGSGALQPCFTGQGRFSLSGWRRCSGRAGLL